MRLNRLILAAGASLLALGGMAEPSAADPVRVTTRVSSGAGPKSFFPSPSLTKFGASGQAYAWTPGGC